MCVKARARLANAVMHSYRISVISNEYLGNTLICRLYDPENKSFGLRLTGDTIEQHLKLLRGQRAAWLKRNPELRSTMQQALLKDRPPCVRKGDVGCPVGEAVTQ